MRPFFCIESRRCLSSRKRTNDGSLCCWHISPCHLIKASISDFAGGSSVPLTENRIPLLRSRSIPRRNCSNEPGIRLTVSYDSADMPYEVNSIVSRGGIRTKRSASSGVIKRPLVKSITDSPSRRAKRYSSTKSDRNNGSPPVNRTLGAPRAEA